MDVPEPEHHHQVSTNVGRAGPRSREKRTGGKRGRVSRAFSPSPASFLPLQLPSLPHRCLLRLARSFLLRSYQSVRRRDKSHSLMMFPSQPDTFSPSQLTSSQNAAADSTTPSKMRGASSTMPLTVKQIADAQQSGTGEKGAAFVVDGVEIANIRLVGMVNGKAERTTDVTFTLDDGTGRLDFIRWVNDASDSTETAAIQNGMYVSVVGTLKGLLERKRATAFSIRPITDFNEVTLHFIQCVRMHIENTKSKVGSPAQTNSSMGTSVLNGEASTPTSWKPNPAPVTSGTNGSKADLNQQVLDIFREPANVESEHGVHFDEIAKRFKLPESKIWEAIRYNEDIGHIYSTIDDFHFKSALTD